MKRNEIKALADKTISELQTQLTEIVAEMTKARLAKKTGRLTNLRSVSNLRRDAARVKTILRIKQLTEAKAVITKDIDEES